MPNSRFHAKSKSDTRFLSSVAKIVEAAATAGQGRKRQDECLDAISLATSLPQTAAIDFDFCELESAESLEAAVGQVWELKFGIELPIEHESSESAARGELVVQVDLAHKAITSVRYRA